ncbi:sulfatase-like hydrolase/transferase [Neorhodopirellula pilleata]|uniref:Extracellular exo-alpha-(1->5)-L-arabinofuranosidase n=1 Tax=Neorhodopirellula pilleata TaxID=2714738 RepID=A0A5C5ZQ43_9BACT|nr:sulfatase-like hydrolase/transferase [Neorhodopirellula pilleata]TWT89218.1 Extracellular exo-alpha-(1->5)-L-arabinofuranosidase precursor [Neorhodopirellula pilleata]
MIFLRSLIHLASLSASFMTLAAIAATPDGQAGSRKPDMVVFLSDDHTWRDSSVYGSPDIRTPNMQRLASAGMTFEQAFVASPSCAPSRAALLTGMYPANNGAEPNHSRPHADLKKLPAYLQEAGYQVVSFGKVGHYRQTTEYGFDIARHFNYHEDVAVDEAVMWLKDRKSTKPLCLFVGTNWPHVPWPTDTEDIDQDELVVPPNHIDTPTSRTWRARYVAAIGKMDQELGKVYDAAREVLGDDVFFLHTSDHGAQWPFGKWNLYEDGVRTPLIVSWPGRIANGTRTNAMVSWIDILPTLLDVADEASPTDIDGRSFLPVLQGKTAEHRDVIYTTHSGDGSFNVFPIRAARTADGCKYIRNLHPEFRFLSHVTKNTGDSGYWSSWVDAATTDPDAREKVRNYQIRPAEEFYNTNTDPYEQVNLVNEPRYQSELDSLRKSIDGWMRETGDTQTVFGPPQPLANQKPNIITVFIDDMGWSDLSSYGGTRTTTENIDRLADEGLRFRNFYVNSPICSPSRVALSTGQYPQRHRISSYLAHRDLNRSRGVAQWLDPSAPMLARELKNTGYTTGHFGKWHMGGQRDVGDAPLIGAYGFDESLTNFEGLGPRVLPLKDAYDGKPAKKHDLGSGDLGRGPIRWEDRSVITAAFVDEALTFIDRAAASDQPFFVNLWPDDVHSPFFPPEVLRDQTDESKRALYYAVLDAMDQQLGVLFDRVRNDEKLRDNTLILVMSDNGHEEGAGSSDPLRGAKTWLYEGGVRSPLIVWGPGVLADDVAGTTNDTSVLCALDVNRSLYTLAGISPPDDVQLDGENLLPTILGREKESRDAPIFWRRPPDRPGNQDQDNPDLAVRDGRWKYLVNYDGSDPQLYDLHADPSESTNQIDKHNDVAQRLHAELMKWNEQLPKDAGDPSWPGPDNVGSLEPNLFVNPIAEGADPWVTRDPNADRYLWCFSDGNRAIAIHTSDTLTSIGTKHIVWRAPDEGPYSQEIWAPELHCLDDRWHIYFAASDGDNHNHLAYVLRSETSDPLGSYELVGPLATGEGDSRDDPNIWAIDMTVLQHNGKRYAVWSGWDAPGTDQQYLYIAAMTSPTELVGPRVRICDNDDYLWERVEPQAEARGLNEGPQVFQAKNSTAIVYSCGGSWLPTYKLGLLELTGDDPLKPESWTKRNKPIFEGNASTYGIGHSCFVKSPDEKQWWHVFHAKRDRSPGWRRVIYVQPMQVGRRGYPIFGEPANAGVPLPRPSGDPPRPVSDSTGSFSYYGHHQYATIDSETIRLGHVPETPINEYRSGEKVVLDHDVPDDFQAQVAIDFLGNANARDAGMLFRCTGASVGYDAQRGYFAGLIPQTNLVILGTMDGSMWRELTRTQTTIDTAKPQQLFVDMKGDQITVKHNGETKIEHSDDTYSSGTVGLRVVNTDAVFSEFLVK